MGRRDRPHRWSGRASNAEWGWWWWCAEESQEALLHSMSWLNPMLHVHQLDASGEGGFHLSQELFIHNRGNPQFLTFNHLTTAHVSMATGMETRCLLQTGWISTLFLQLWAGCLNLLSRKEKNGWWYDKNARLDLISTLLYHRYSMNNAGISFAVFAGVQRLGGCLNLFCFVESPHGGSATVL